jgi:hypothetical protein
MAPKAISSAVIGTLLILGLAATVAFADEPASAPAAGQTEAAVRTQAQVEDSNGHGSPLAVPGQEVDQKSTRQLGPGDGSGSQAETPAAGSGEGPHARVEKGSRPDGTTSTKAAKRSKRGAKGLKAATSPAIRQQRLRDPDTGCAGVPTMTRAQGSSGQRRGGGRR